VVVVGDSGVGKTNLLTRFCKNEFCQSSKPTIGKRAGRPNPSADRCSRLPCCAPVNCLALRPQAWSLQLGL
jgi:hypothetical protein